MKDVKKLLGQRIKDLRKQQGMSQEELAEIINIDQRNLSHIECGVSFPAKKLLEIANALKVSLCDLFDFEYFKNDKNLMKKFIVNELDNLSDENIKILFRLIKSMR